MSLGACYALTALLAAGSLLLVDSGLHLRHNVFYSIAGVDGDECASVLTAEASLVGVTLLQILESFLDSYRW